MDRRHHAVRHRRPARPGAELQVRGQLPARPEARHEPPLLRERRLPRPRHRRPLLRQMGESQRHLRPQRLRCGTLIEKESPRPPSRSVAMRSSNLETVGLPEEPVHAVPVEGREAEEVADGLDEGSSEHADDAREDAERQDADQARNELAVARVRILFRKAEVVQLRARQFRERQVEGRVQAPILGVLQNDAEHERQRHDADRERDADE
mmetsp:Transcript_24868/g.76792  ORF Transcript_24868/g.76792 Transcript_24868/m.76792 type:complete len:209 (+) Transcript_24868:183-809(+)